MYSVWRALMDGVKEESMGGRMGRGERRREEVVDGRVVDDFNVFVDEKRC
jgi:hypothetical protein